MAIDKSAIKAFAKRWDGIGYEKGDTQQYWLQLLRALGYAHSDDVKFEHHLPGGGFIDVWIRDAGVLVEQKSIEIDLDKPEPRQGKLKTPLEQAMDYVVDLPLSEQPRFIITCNFKQFRIYDREKYGRSELADNAFEFTLEEMADRPEYLNIIVDPQNSRLEKEKQVSIEAGRLIGQLYNLMRDGYIDPDSEESQHALNVLCVRLVFCLYCEDSDLFPKDSFFNFLKDVPAQNIRTNLKRLFKALDTPVKERDPYDVSLKGFPYVNGGLFKDETEIPNFNEEAKDFLLNKVSAPVNWSQISPTIFGGIFESTLNPETRRKGGMHYTSPENIHKVIDPLFLDDLKEEFNSIRADEELTPRQKKNRYRNFHQKLCSLKFLESKTQNLIQINDCPLRGVAQDLGVSVLQTGAFLYIGDVVMATITKKQMEEYERLRRDRDNGRLLTPDGLRLICAAYENDPEKIGIHMLEMLAKFRNEGIID